MTQGVYMCCRIDRLQFPLLSDSYSRSIWIEREH